MGEERALGLNAAGAENPCLVRSAGCHRGRANPQASAVRRVRDGVCGTDRVQKKGWTIPKSCPRKWEDHGLWNQAAGCKFGQDTELPEFSVSSLVKWG